jgi:hypothetical protein
MNLEEHIKAWVLHDNQLKAYNDKAKEIRGKRATIGNNIIHHMSDRYPTHSTIEISDGRLKLTTTNTATPLSYKFLEDSIQSYFNDKVATERLMAHIKERRETKSSTEIKRFYSS